LAVVAAEVTQVDRPFVLVHGGCHGGWAWTRVAGRLRSAGYQVFTPTLTGLGERLHLSGPGVDLNTHIQDVLAVLECEELQHAVVVAHSYAGYPVTGAADRDASRIGHLIYLDASIGRDGTAIFDNLPPEVVQEKLASAADLNGGKVMAPLDVVGFYGVTDPADAEWVGRRVTPQPAGTYTTPLSLSHPVGNGLPCTFIRCTDPALSSIEESYAYAREAGMPLHELKTGHDAMVTAPGELAALLIEIASQGVLRLTCQLAGDGGTVRADVLLPFGLGEGVTGSGAGDLRPAAGREVPLGHVSPASRGARSFGRGDEGFPVRGKGDAGRDVPRAGRKCERPELLT
jgi:pimeloyl-ACP methyl ester carboxylesterase